MISDEQRREVAEKLRNQLAYMRSNAEWYEEELDVDECGNRAYRNIAASVEEYGNVFKGNYANIVERLADLIDRPTCNNVSEFGNNTGSNFDFVCSRCGSRLLSEKMGGSPLIDDRFRHYSIRFCPNCGAEVVE